MSRALAHWGLLRQKKWLNKPKHLRSKIINEIIKCILLVTFLLLSNYIIRCLIHTRHKIQKCHQGEHRNGSLEPIKLDSVAITVLREENSDLLVPKY